MRAETPGAKVPRQPARVEPSYKLRVYPERSRRVKRLNPYLGARSCLDPLGAQEGTGELQRFSWQQLNKINDNRPDPSIGGEGYRIRLIDLFWKRMVTVE